MRMTRLTRLGVLLILFVSLSASGCATLKRMFRPADAGTSEQALAYYGEAMARIKSGQAATAEALLQKAISHDPGMYYAYYPLGKILQDAGHPAKAKETWVMGLSHIKEFNERKEYPSQRAGAEMRAALASLASGGGMREITPARPAPRPLPVAKPPATMVRPLPIPAARPKPMPKPKPAMAPKSMAKAMGKRSGPYAVVVSSNLKLASAKAQMQMLKKRGYVAHLTKHRIKGKTWYRVWVACCKSLREARIEASRVKGKRLSKSPMVMKYPGK